MYFKCVEGVELVPVVRQALLDVVMSMRRKKVAMDIEEMILAAFYEQVVAIDPIKFTTTVWKKVYGDCVIKSRCCEIFLSGSSLFHYQMKTTAWKPNDVDIYTYGIRYVVEGVRAILDDCDVKQTSDYTYRITKGPVNINVINSRALFDVRFYADVVELAYNAKEQVFYRRWAYGLQVSTTMFPPVKVCKLARITKSMFVNELSEFDINPFLADQVYARYDCKIETIKARCRAMNLEYIYEDVKSKDVQDYVLATYDIDSDFAPSEIIDC